MYKSDAIINKNLYKIFLIVVKYTPLTSSVVQIISTICNYFGVTVLGLTYFGGISILFTVLLFIIAEVFKFCYLFTIPLWYNTIMLLLGLLRSFGFIPIDLLSLYRLYVIILGIFIIIFIGYAYKNKDRLRV